MNTDVNMIFNFLAQGNLNKLSSETQIDYLIQLASTNEYADKLSEWLNKHQINLFALANQSAGTAFDVLNNHLGSLLSNLDIVKTFCEWQLNDDFFQAKMHTPNTLAVSRVMTALKTDFKAAKYFLKDPVADCLNLACTVTVLLAYQNGQRIDLFKLAKTNLFKKIKQDDKHLTLLFKKNYSVTLLMLKYTQSVKTCYQPVNSSH